MLPADINLVYICTIMARHDRPLSSPFGQPSASFAPGSLTLRDGGPSAAASEYTSREIRTPSADAGKGGSFPAYEITVKAGATYRIELSDCERYWLATIITPSSASRFRVFSNLDEALDAGLAWARHQRAS